MEITRYLLALRRAHGDTLPLNGDQLRAVTHCFTKPLWIVAGPGTGKTHTLVWLVFKRILVDGAAPETIFLTTFTRRPRPSSSPASSGARTSLSRQA
jgi:Superfamily I DNA and RNA helicases